MKIRTMVTMLITLLMVIAPRVSPAQITNIDQAKVSVLKLKNELILERLAGFGAASKWWATRSSVWACDSLNSALISLEIRKATEARAPMSNGCQLLKPWTTGIMLSDPVQDILPVAINDGSWLKAWIAVEDLYYYHPEAK